MNLLRRWVRFLKIAIGQMLNTNQAKVRAMPRQCTSLRGGLTLPLVLNETGQALDLICG